MTSSIDVTATANAAGGPFKGDWVSGTNYTKGDIVLDTSDSTRYAATSDITPSTTAPSADSGLLGKWRKAEQKDSSVIAAFVLAIAKTRLTGTSAIAAGGDDDVVLTASVKTNVTSAADASSTGSGASVAVIVMITDSQAYVDSTHATPVTGKSLTISADTDNAAPTSATSSPAGANDNAATPQGTNANSPTQQATTRVNGAHVLGATLTVHTTGGFANSGSFTVEGIAATCAYAGRTDTTFTGISGCSGSVADGAYVRGTSQQQATPASSQANNQSKTSDGNQNLSAALAVVVLVATTQAYISAADTATHTISTAGGANKIHAGAKHATSATADGGNVKFSPSAPTLSTAAGGSLAVDTTYFYKVTAVFGAAESLPSAEASKKTSSTDKTIELNWTAVAGATGYKVYRGTASGDVKLLTTLGAVTTFNDDGSLTPGAAAPPTSDPTSGYGIAVAVNVADRHHEGVRLRKNDDQRGEPHGRGARALRLLVRGRGDVGRRRQQRRRRRLDRGQRPRREHDRRSRGRRPVAAERGPDADRDLEHRRTWRRRSRSSRADGNTTGIGASFAVNVVNDTTIAGIADGTEVVGISGNNPDNVVITATSTDAMTTTAEGGASAGSGSFALSAQAAIAISNVTTSATIGTGAALTVGGTVTATATQTASTTTKAKGSTKGGNAGIGLSLALLVANHLVDSQLERDLTAGGNVSFTASGSSANVTDAAASSAGAKEKSGSGATDGDGSAQPTVNDKADANLGQGNTRSQNSAGNGSGSTTTPEAKSGENGGTKVTVAAAAGIALITAKSIAKIADGLTLTTTGSVKLKTESDTDSSAKANGSATKAATANIGAAAAINLVTVVNEAVAGANTVITSNGLELAAVMRNTGGADGKHTFLTDATAGAGGGKVAVAGSLALAIIDVKTNAQILSNFGRGPPGHDLNSNDLVLTATSVVTSTAKAKAKAEDSGTVGVGAGAAINSVDDNTTALIDAGARVTEAKDITLTATGTNTLTSYAEAGTAGAAGSTLALTADAAVTLARRDDERLHRRHDVRDADGERQDHADRDADGEVDDDREGRRGLRHRRDRARARARDRRPHRDGNDHALGERDRRRRVPLRHRLLGERDRGLRQRHRREGRRGRRQRRRLRQGRQRQGERPARQREQLADERHRQDRDEERHERRQGAVVRHEQRRRQHGHRRGRLRDRDRDDALRDVARRRRHDRRDRQGQPRLEGEHRLVRARRREGDGGGHGRYRRRRRRQQGRDPEPRVDERRDRERERARGAGADEPDLGRRDPALRRRLVDDRPARAGVPRVASDDELLPADRNGHRRARPSTATRRWGRR